MHIRNSSYSKSDQFMFFFELEKELELYMNQSAYNSGSTCGQANAFIKQKRHKSEPNDRQPDAFDEEKIISIAMNWEKT
jgi:hypothetical protein